MKNPLFFFGKVLKGLLRPKPRTRVWRTMVGILALFVLTSLLSYPKAWNDAVDWYNERVTNTSGLGWARLPQYWDIPFRLGLDLQGGTHLVYEADTSAIPDLERADALEGVRDVIERRVNAFGVSEPIVQTNRSGGKWRIIVELAGVKDVNQAIQMIGETPILEFKEEKDVADIELTDEQKAELDELHAEARGVANTLQQKVRSIGDDVQFSVFANENDDAEDRITIAGQALGLISEDGPFTEFWSFANRNPGAKFTFSPVETDESFNILRINEKNTDSSEIEANHILICFDGATQCEGGASKEDVLSDITALRKQATPANFAELAKLHSSEPGASETGGDLGSFGRGVMVPPFEEAAFALGVGEISEPVETEFGYHLIHKRSEQPVVLYDVDVLAVGKAQPIDVAPQLDPWQNTGLSGKHLQRSQVQFSHTTNEPQVILEFNDEGDQLFEEITDRNVGQLVGIFLDGQPISVPRVHQKITGGNAVISGQFDIQEAKLLAQRLNAGALPVPIDLLSQQTVGASLGQDSLQKSMKAGLIGFIIVALFMILYYRLPGILAAIALVMYTAFTLALFKLFGVTLTLSGIAGFILSVGMAVDANILIFERMKEELKNGQPLDGAISEGFTRAWTSIRDSNVSSLITAAILYSFTSSSVRGFALTLAIGILVSMFSAIYVTRTMLRIVVPWTKKKLWLYK